MPIAKTRISISVTESVRDALAKLARRDQVPEATKAAHLLQTALEIEEDIFWDTLARERDRKNVRYTSHAKAWK